MKGGLEYYLALQAYPRKKKHFEEDSLRKQQSGVVAMLEMLRQD